MKQRTGSAASEGRHRGVIAKAHDLHFGVDYWPAETILSHPDFPEARRVYLDRVLALYGEDIFLNILLMEAARTVILVVIICMEAGYREDDRETWPTIGNLTKDRKSKRLHSSH